MVALGVTIFENGLRRFRNAAGLAQAQTLDPVFMRPHAVWAERFCGGSVSDFPLSDLAETPEIATHNAGAVRARCVRNGSQKSQF